MVVAEGQVERDHLEADARVGLGHGWDLGARAWLSPGVQLEVKRELLDAGPHALSLGLLFGG